MTTKSNNDDKDYSVLQYYLNKQTLGDLKKIINHFKQLVKNESETLSIEKALNGLTKKNHDYSGKKNKKKDNLRKGLEAIANFNKEGNDNEIDIYEWILFNKYMELNNDKDKEKFLKNSQEKINGLKEDRPYNEIRTDFMIITQTKYEEYLKILEKFRSNQKVTFLNDPKSVLPLQKLYKSETNINLKSARSILTSRAELAATQRDISVTMSKIRGELMNEWKKLYEKFKEMYKDSYIILNQQSIPIKDFEIYLENPICESQNISQKKFNKFINLQGQTEQKEVLYKVNKIILLCRYVNELYCIIGNFKDKLKNEQITIADKGIEELKEIIENLLKINTKDNKYTLDIDSICENIKKILKNFKKVIKGIKSDLDVPFIKDNFEVIEIPNYMKSTNSKESPENKNVVNFKEILEQIKDQDNNATNLLEAIKEDEKEEFNLSKIVVDSNRQDNENFQKNLKIMLKFYSVYYKKNRQKIKQNPEHQAFIKKLNNKLIDILNKGVILNIKLLKYNFLDAKKVYEEIIKEIERKKTKRKKTKIKK